MTIARPIPMKRELKVFFSIALDRSSNFIARPIPMKRELKAPQTLAGRRYGDNRKAHPDEKGTESLKNWCLINREPRIARPIPMKRELKAN